MRELSNGKVAARTCGLMPIIWLCATGAYAIDDKPAIDRKTIVVAISSDLGSLDPQVGISVDSARYGWEVFSTLYGFDPKGDLEPRVATSYEIGEGGRRYTFKLRHDVKFQNGDALTAADVKFSVERILDAATKSTRRPFFINLIESVETQGDDTVIFNLKNPDGAFMNKIAGYLYLVPKAYTQSLASPEAFAQAPIGSGPFQVVDHKIGQSIEFKRFEGYYGPAPSIDRLIYRVVPEAASRANAILSGEADVAAEIAFTDVDRLKNNPGLRIESGSSGSPLHVRIYSNVPDSPFHKLDVRLALNYAVDKDSIIKNVLRGRAAPLPSFTPSSYPYGVDKQVKGFPYDPAKATELLRKAGYPRGFKTQLNCASVFQKEICETLAAYWSAVGIQTEIKVMDYVAFNRLNNLHQSGPLSLSEFGNAIYDPIHPLFGSAAKDGTWSDYDNPAVEHLFEKVSRVDDRTERDRIFKEINAALRDDGQAVLLAEQSFNFAVDREIDWTPQQGSWIYDFRTIKWK